MKKSLVLTVLSLIVGNIGTHSAHARSLTVSQALTLKHNMIVSKHTINWYHGPGHWTLHEKFPTCKAVARRYSPQRADICYKARVTLQMHAERYNKIHSILYPVPQYDPLVGAFMCIHRYEGAWNDNTGNGFYGGLQMDMQFMSLYGGSYMHQWGTANNWPVWAQIQAAKNAYHSGRGFWPWPNTARACGLL